MRLSVSVLALAAWLMLPAASLAEEAAKPVVEDGKSISIEYTLTLDDGSTADTNVGSEPLVYVQGGGQILPALETALAGMTIDQTKHVKLDAEHGYGPVNPDAFQEVEAEVIPEDAREVGAQLVAQDASGRQRPVRVSSVDGDKITLDLNHPLAGKNLTFDVKILAIQDAP
jgi:FKBP-type peptidyl-prolyl cis-trans isomerase SlyD